MQIVRITLAALAAALSALAACSEARESPGTAEAPIYKGIETDDCAKTVFMIDPGLPR